jgi:DNA-binding GntR family transcriptional regulator
MDTDLYVGLYTSRYPEHYTRGNGVDISQKKLYKILHDMVISFQFSPDTNISESALAKRFGVSRTPIRQTLQELVTQKLLIQRPSKGFYSRRIDKKEIFDLYELRECVEAKSVILACKNASDEELQGLYNHWKAGRSLPPDSRTETLHKRDRHFHMYIADLGNNRQILDLLSNINDRIYFIRWIDMTDRAEATQTEHEEIVRLLMNRQGKEAAAVMQSHINRRMEDIELSIKEAYARIFTGHLPVEE